jgi:hypothetical protein
VLCCAVQAMWIDERDGDAEWWCDMQCGSVLVSCGVMVGEEERSIVRLNSMNNDSHSNSDGHIYCHTDSDSSSDGYPRRSFISSYSLYDILY